MAPAKVCRHLKSVHGELKEKYVEFFIPKHEELLKLINCTVQTAKTVNEKASESSYLVRYLDTVKLTQLPKSQIKPCAMYMVKFMVDEKSAKEISKSLLLNNTVANCINDLAANI